MDPFLNPFPAVGCFPGSHDGFYRDISINTVIFHIFHVASVLEVISLENRILMTVEIKRGDIMSVTEFFVEGGGSFDPFAIQIELGVTMEHKQIRAEKFQ